MERKGSITVFLALTLSVLVVLVSALLESVRVSCGRAHVLNGADVGLYSLFAQYDRELLESYETVSYTHLVLCHLLTFSRSSTFCEIPTTAEKVLQIYIYVIPYSHLNVHNPISQPPGKKIYGQTSRHHRHSKQVSI